MAFLLHFITQKFLEGKMAIKFRNGIYFISALFILLNCGSQINLTKDLNDEKIPIYLNDSKTPSQHLQPVGLGYNVYFYQKDVQEITKENAWYYLTSPFVEDSLKSAISNNLTWLENYLGPQTNERHILRAEYIRQGYITNLYPIFNYIRNNAKANYAVVSDVFVYYIKNEMVGRSLDYQNNKKVLLFNLSIPGVQNTSEE